MKKPLQNKEDVLFVLDKIDNSRDKAIIALISDTGLYLDELRFLSISQINTQTKYIQTKSPRPRNIPLSSLSEPSLIQWLKDRPKTKHPTLFTSLTGAPSTLSQRGIDNIIRKWSDTTNIDMNYQKLRTLSKTQPSTSAQPLPPETAKNKSSISSISLPFWPIIMVLCGLISFLTTPQKK